MSLTADPSPLAALSSDAKSQLTPPMEAHSLTAQLNGTNHSANLASTEQSSIGINGDHKPALLVEASAIPPSSGVALSPVADDSSVALKPTQTASATSVAIADVDPEDATTTSVPPAIAQSTSDLRDDSSAVPPMAQQLAHSDPAADQPMADAPVSAAQPNTTLSQDPSLDDAPNTLTTQPVQSATALVAEPVDVDMGIPAAEGPSETQTAAEEALTTGQVRPREDDDVGEPAAKRTRLDEEMAESVEVAPQASLAPEQSAVDTSAASNGISPTTVPDASAAAPVDAPAMPAPAAAAKPPAHYDDKAINPAQYKHILELIRRVKKTKSARFFLQPVDYVQLNIPTYPQIIAQPMDLSTMEEKLKGGKYTSANAVAADMDLIASNTNTFNGFSHPVSVDGANMKAYFDRVMQTLPRGVGVDVEVQKKKATPVPKPAPIRREQRQIPQPVAISPPPKPVEVKHEPYVDPNGMPLIRRDSSAANNDRPKREIHPPKNRDLPYPVRPKKKKTQVEMRFCDYALKELNKPRYSQLNWIFMYPVDPVALNIPTYFKVVKKPTDLTTIRTKLDNGEFSNAKEFHSEIKLMFNNCFKFNPPEDAVHQSGKQLEQVFDETWAGKDEWIANNTRSEVASEADDDEEEDAVSEEEPVDPQVQRMLDIQRQIAALSQEAMALSTAGLPGVSAPRAKVGSPKAGGKKKKSSTGGAPKPKRQGSLGGSGLGGASSKPSKKAKKPVFKKLTLDQKRFVSEGIGGLDEAQMRKAVQIIRNGVPSLRNVTDDELELDIDEIPDEVVFDLYQFVRKITPKSALISNTDTAADADDDYDDDDGSYAGGGHKSGKSGGRSKKNKPMSAREQESKIAQVQAQLQRFQGGSGSDDAEAHQRDDSSDDEASESSEEE